MFASVRRLAAASVALLMTTSVAVVGTGVFLPVPDAEAIVVNPITPTFESVVNGDFVSVGNGVLVCDTARPPLPGSSSCPNLHSGSSASFNDQLFMTNVDVDANPATFNSSRATVTVPAGASVVHAQLYWAGNTGVVQGSPGVRCGTNNVGSNGYQAPAGGPSTTNPVLTVGEGAATTVPVANYASEGAGVIANGQPQYYSASQDVTAAFASIPTGSAQTITVGNIWAPSGYGCFGGWSLSVVYDFGSFNPTNPATTARTVFLYDGHVRKFSGEAPDTVSFGGFNAQGPGTRASFTLYEGDAAITGDTATYTSTTNSSPIQIQNARGENGNIGISRATGSTRFPNAPGPDPFINASVDVRNTPLTGVTAGATGVTLNLATSGDSYLLQNVALSVPTAAVRIDKTADGVSNDQIVPVGGNPTFTIRVFNAGSVPLTNVAVADALAPGCVRTIGSLAVAPEAGSELVYTCEGPPATAGYTNTATVAGQPPTGGPVTNVSTTGVRVADLQVVKTATPPVVESGGTTTWSVVVTNTGQVDLVDIDVDDPVVPACSATGLSLAPGASTTLTCTSTVTGAIENTVVATGVAAEDPDVTVTDTSVARADSTQVRLDKATDGVITDVDGDGTHSAGDTKVYTFEVFNGGSVPLTDVVVTDPMVGTVTCPGTVPVGESVLCDPVTYPITQAQVDAGVVTNTATVDASGNGVPVTATDSTTTTLSSTSSIDLVKSVSPVRTAGGDPVAPGEAVAGDVVDFSLTVTNTGATTLGSFTIDDPLLGDVFTCADTTLAPETSTTCGPVPYELTQADIDTALVENTATIDATAPNGDEVSDTSTVRTNLGTEGGALQVSKAAGTLLSQGSYAAGDTVPYTFTVTNTGNTTLTDLELDDPLVPGITCPETTLAPGDVVVCTADPLELTQEQIDAGGVVNTVSATAEDPQGNPVEDEGTQQITVTGQSRIEVVKTLVGDPPTNPVAGDVVTFDLAVTNTGAVTVTDLAVTDLDLGIDLVCDPDTLAPGEVASCGQVEHELTQADIDAGRAVDTAVGTGTSTTGVPVQDDSTVVVPIERASEILATKTATDIVDANDSGVVDAGDTIDYTVTVQNTGGTTLTGVTVSDPLLGDAPLTCAPTTVLPGAVSTCGPATYELTQADIDAGTVVNVAVAQATDPDGEVLEEEPSITVPAPAVGELELTKTAGDVVDANDSGVVDAGDTISYDFTVANVGATTVDTLVLTDPLLGGALACDDLEEPLAPGDVVECGPLTYTITQADIDAGLVENVAEVTGEDLNGPLAAEDDATVELDAPSSIALVKDGVFVDDDGNGRPDVGDTVSYTFTATNTGATTLSDVTVTDPLLGDEPIACTPSTLAPEGVASCGPVSYTLTQADVDTGGVDNLAVVSATPPGGGDPVTNEAEETVPLPADPELTLTKSAGPVVDANESDLVDAGDTVEYTFTVENTGNTTIGSVTVTDPLIDDEITCDPTTLAPGDTVECTAVYVLTVDDVTAGGVDNTATVSGTGVGGSPDPEDDSDTESITLAQVSSMALTKTASEVLDPSGAPVLDGEVSEGDVIVYTFSVQNTGTTRITDVAVTDAAIPDADLVCTPSTLDPAEIAECGEATYVLTQADVDAGVFVNDATATAVVDAPDGAELEDTTSTPRAFNGNSALALAKSGSVPADSNDSGRLDAGDTVAYTFEVTNAGTETVSGITVSDPLLGGDPIPCEPSELIPGDVADCGPVTYTLTQADIDAGGRANTAQADGVDPDGEPVLSPEDTVVLTYQAPSATELEKSVGPVVDANESGRVDAGDTIAYSFVVTNTGAKTLTDPVVTDPLLGDDPIVCLPATLAPEETADCGPVAYVLTQADLDAGVRDNVATATATPPEGQPAPEPSTDDASVALDQEPSIGVVKSAGPIVDANESGRVDAGDTIAYTFVVTNTGTTTLTEASVTDPLLPGETFVCALPVGGLAPDGEVECGPGTYTLTQDDVDAGEVVNTAVATGTDVTGEPVEEPSNEVVTPVESPSSLDLAKSAGPIVDANESGRVDAGDTITYDFVVTNTGAATITSLTLTDALQPDGADPITCEVPVGGLLPDAQVSCASFVHTLTQADLDATVVVNGAEVTGTRDNGPDPDPATDSVVSTVPVLPQLTTEKSLGEIVDANDSGVVDAGDTVDYTITVTNTGTVTVNDVVVTDPLLSDEPLTCSDTVLAPEDSLSCGPVTYELTQGDLDAGSVLNVATGTGTWGPQDTPVEDDGQVTLPLDGQPGVALTKTIGDVEDTNGTGRLDAGDSVTYEFAITNTGATTLTEASISDPRLGADPIACDLGDGLAPADSVSCDSATYVLTQADVDSGTLANTATVNAVDTLDQPAVGEDTVTIPLPAISELVLQKAATPVQVSDESGLPTPGDVIDYTFTVTNIGTVTVDDVAVTDPLLGDDTILCEPTSLAPGDAAECGPVPYAISQADIDAGAVVNTAEATAVAQGEAEDPEPATDTVTVPVPGAPSLTLVKEAGEVVDANGSGVVDAGDTVDFVVVVSNDGNTTVRDLVVTDPLLSDEPLTCLPTDLLPGATSVCVTPTYTLTQADVDAGEVVNTATAVGVSGPDDEPVTDDDTVTVPVDGEPAVSLVKAVVGITDTNGSDTVDAGDEVGYTFTVTNSGSTTLTEAEVVDERISAEPVVCDLGDGLAPGDSVTCGPVAYLLTQADVDAGEVANVATVLATDVLGGTAEDDDDVTVALDSPAAVDLVKEATGVLDTNGSGLPDAGDTIDYTFTVTNTGAVTLDQLEVTDPLLGGAVQCPAGSLAPGASVVCGPIAYTLTQADIDAGTVLNEASVTGVEPGGDTVDDADDATVVVEQVATVELVKEASDVVDANDNGVVDEGDTIDYTFTVTNTGTTTTSGLTIEDPLLGGQVDCALDVLAPGESAACGPVTYTLGAADLEAGEVVNTATVVGVTTPDPDTDPIRVVDEDTVVTPLTPDDGGPDDGRPDDGDPDDGGPDDGRPDDGDPDDDLADTGADGFGGLLGLATVLVVAGAVMVSWRRQNVLS